MSQQIICLLKLAFRYFFVIPSIRAHRGPDFGNDAGLTSNFPQYYFRGLYGQHDEFKTNLTFQIEILQQVTSFQISQGQW